MAMSPDDLRNKTFNIVKKGYERGEVHRFLGSVADELQAFNAAALSAQEIVVADVVDEQEPEIEVDEIEIPDADDTDDALLEIVDVPDTNEVEEPASLAATNDTSASVQPVEFQSSGSLDDFDRMGNEISLMLRQAQESAFKIRSDAEVEARTLVDQVRLDIESDRLAHEQAAAELIQRTEERASAVRTEAESYAEQVRSSADTYATEQREDADRQREQALSDAEADRTSAEATLANAKEEAEATISSAKSSADEVLTNAESEAQARADEIISEANNKLATLTDAEQDSRSNLEQARASIDEALAQLAESDD